MHDNVPLFAINRVALISQLIIHRSYLDVRDSLGSGPPVKNRRSRGPRTNRLLHLPRPWPSGLQQYLSDKRADRAGAALQRYLALGESPLLRGVSGVGSTRVQHPRVLRQFYIQNSTRGDHPMHSGYRHGPAQRDPRSVHRHCAGIRLHQQSAYKSGNLLMTVRTDRSVVPFTLSTFLFCLLFSSFQMTLMLFMLSYSAGTVWRWEQRNVIISCSCPWSWLR